MQAQNKNYFEATAAGMGWRTVQRACDEIGAIREKNQFSGGWQWRLPKPGNEDAKSTCHVEQKTEDLASWHLRKNSEKSDDSACQFPEGAKLNHLGTLGGNGQLFNAPPGFPDGNERGKP